MVPPMRRLRYNANKNIPSPPVRLRVAKKKSSFTLATTRKDKDTNKSSPIDSGGPESLNVMPSIETAFKTCVSARLCSAIWSYIADCDETYNYWEPLHYLIYGQGLQTWEYSPEYALRSYAYLLLQGVMGWIYERLFHPTPALIFYMVRCTLGFTCAIMERFMYKSICQEFGIHIARMWLIFQIFSVGMFVSSTALLPSSFAMYFGCCSLAAWWQMRYPLAVVLMAIASLLGWPFAGLLGLPIAIDMIFRQRLGLVFLKWSALSALMVALPMLVVDSHYFGKWTFPPLNIVLYNIFTSHGPNLYGTEPFSYYLFNGFLNFNIIWLFSLLTPLMLVLDHFVVPAKSKSTLNFPRYLTLSPYYLWLLVFFAQAHKEERFLFPVYPLISLCGAITVDICQRVFYRLLTLFRKLRTASATGAHYLDHSMFIATGIIVVSTVMGLSRAFALYRNYHAPMDLMMEFNRFKVAPDYRPDRLYNVCIGKDWHRFPSSFLLPSTNFRVRFLKSEFRGMLPMYFAESPNATQLVHSYFNDRNEEDKRMYFPYEHCQFLIDFDSGNYSRLEPAYSQRTSEWQLLKSLPFLVQDRSNRFFRSFYVPFLSDEYVTYGNFNLLKRNKSNRKMT